MMNLLPDAASAHAAGIDQIIGMVHVLMAVLFVGWGAFFIYVLFRFRQGRNPRADYAGVKSKMSTWLEIAVAAVEAVILVGFAVPIWAERVDQRPPDEESTVVRVVAQQYAWNIWYPGVDGVFGDQDINLVDEETNSIGLVRSGHGVDDITTINQMHLPVDKPAIVRISSKDVIHSFSLPQMRIKQDAIPGLQIPVWFIPTVTTADMREKKGDEEYNYEIACAQLCGNSHYSMRGFLTIDTAEEYQEWLDLEATYLGSGDEDDFWAE